ncbi:MAG: hypothetical protein Q8868_06825 [Bacteroidota bacterium]|nr:hypothetical protein [Bacteroidota bacterium]
MKNKKNTSSKNIKFVRINNSTWIEAAAWIPDEVARIEFLQKMQLAKAGSFPVNVENGTQSTGR